MDSQEPRLETHDDGVKFVMDVFRSMGGRVLPPIRPCHIPRYTPLTIERDNFFMDFENSCLEYNWHIQPQPFDGGLFDSLSFYWNKPHPKGLKRHEDPEWAAMIQSQVYPHHSDVDWEEYVEWVENGGGDEWFRESDDESEEKLYIEEEGSRLESPSPLYCEGCLDPRDFDHTICWRSLPVDEFNRVLVALGTCEFCQNKLTAERTKMSTIQEPEPCNKWQKLSQGILDYNRSTTMLADLGCKPSDLQ